MKPVLLVIAKAPVAGRVKTRLCPPCSPVQAARLAEAALADTLSAAADTPCERRVLVLDGDPGRWLPDGFEVVAQAEGDLGDRLAAAFAAESGPALLIGMDTPQVTPAVLEQAFAELLRPGADAVIGGASDGGWWAIGFKRPAPGAFDGVPMSVPPTGGAQRARLRQLGLRWRELPVLRDVDDIADAQAVAEAAPRSAFAAALRAMDPRPNRV